MFIKISLSQVQEKYYDYDDILDENISNLTPYIKKFVDVSELQKVAQQVKESISDKIQFISEQFYKILYLIVKRSSLFSKQTIQDKVQEKVDAYREAHRTEEKHIDVFQVFRNLFKRYAEIAAEVSEIDYKRLPNIVRESIEKNLYRLIGVQG